VYLPLEPEEEAQLEERLPAIAPEHEEETMSSTVTSWERLGAMKMITQALDKRFGPLDQTVKAQLVKYPYELLEVLNLDQFDFRSLADVKAWLEANPPPPWVDPLGEWDDDEESL